MERYGILDVICEVSIAVSDGYFPALFLNVAPFQGERHGFAVPMVFMTDTRLYTLRYVNSCRNSLIWLAAKPPENANPVNQVNLKHSVHVSVTQSVFLSPCRLKAITTTTTEFFYDTPEEVIRHCVHLGPQFFLDTHFDPPLVCIIRGFVPPDSPDGDVVLESMPADVFIIATGTGMLPVTFAPWDKHTDNWADDSDDWHYNAGTTAEL
ncbi:hypothetical protein KG996_004921 [Salmonella enterica]|nr:hypothetical protein [Salmonella enterica]EEJ5981684.1 hypothetical protein [Salmonella enterica]EGY4988929.1 hypothetical protein [Salmonella enterica]EHG7929971.1 hypothetical protein [Salmonella enterica]EHG7959038.1 hypothetical protein [Salmonella enterica]